MVFADRMHQPLCTGLTVCVSASAESGMRPTGGGYAVDRREWGYTELRLFSVVVVV